MTTACVTTREGTSLPAVLEHVGGEAIDDNSVTGSRCITICHATKDMKNRKI